MPQTPRAAAQMGPRIAAIGLKVFGNIPVEE
jgi:hypothetical protein